jgi:hypothetical protein
MKIPFIGNKDDKDGKDNKVKTENSDRFGKQLEIKESECRCSDCGTEHECSICKPAKIGELSTDVSELNELSQCFCTMECAVQGFMEIMGVNHEDSDDVEVLAMPGPDRPISWEEDIGEDELMTAAKIDRINTILGLLNSEGPCNRQKIIKSLDYSKEVCVNLIEEGLEVGAIEKTAPNMYDFRDPEDLTEGGPFGEVN